MPNSSVSLPISSMPLTFPFFAKVHPWSSSLCTAALPTIHRSFPFAVSTSISSYTASGCTKRLVIPRIVSCLNVADTRILPSSSLCLTNKNSCGTSPSPSTLSWSPIGILSFGHQTTGWLPLSTSPFSFSLRNCHLMNLSYLGFMSVVMKLLLQSTLAPNFCRSSFAAGTNTSTQC